MTELERQLTEALKKLSVQYEREQRRHPEQIEALRQHVKRQKEEGRALKMRIELLDGQVTRLAECYGTLAATLCARVS